LIGHSRALTTVNLRKLVACAEAAECSKPSFNSEVVSRTKDCYLLTSRSKLKEETVVAAASNNSVLICGWVDTGLILIKQVMVKESITALLMTKEYVLFGNQSVYDIDLKTFEVNGEEN